MAQLINNIHETGELPKDFIEVTLNDLLTYSMEQSPSSEANQ